MYILFLCVTLPRLIFLVSKKSIIFVQSYFKKLYAYDRNCAIKRVFSLAFKKVRTNYCYPYGSASIANQLKFLKLRTMCVGRNKYILNWYRKHHYCVRMTQSNLKAAGAFSGYDGSPAIMFYKLGHSIWLINTIWNLYIRRTVTLHVILLVNNRRYFGFYATVINHVLWIVILWYKRFRNVKWLKSNLFCLLCNAGLLYKVVKGVQRQRVSLVLFLSFLCLFNVTVVNGHCIDCFLEW